MATCAPWVFAQTQSADAADLQPVVVPISRGLGLADVSIDLPDSGAALPASASILLLAPDGRTLRAPLLPIDPDRPRHWTARVMTGPPATVDAPLTFRLTFTDAAGIQTQGPEQHGSCAPPTTAATPDWAKGAVWYQIFVERFRNANPVNDPRPPEFFLAPWNSDYETVTVDELDLARARAAGEPVPRSLNPHRRGGQLGNVLPDRRYGGDLEGVVEKLDELHDLGVTALYLNPIFHAHTSHKYDASDYRHIDPAFAGPGRTDAEAAAVARETADPTTWTLTAADRYLFDTLAPEVHRRGMHLVLDGVWNHTGTEFWAFRDIIARGVESPYKDWFQCEFATPEKFPDWRDAMLDVRPGHLIGWKSWGGASRNGGLPEFARDRATGRLQPDVERHIFDIARRWSPAIDGWRLDVVPDLPRPFWRAWSDHIRALNPDAALYAEVWFDATGYFSAPDAPKTFDGQMNYPFAMPAVRWLRGDADMPADKLADRFRRVFHHAPQHDLVQMNLFGSHDTERLASMLANPGGAGGAGGRDYDQQASPTTNRNYDANRPSPEVYQRVALGAALQAVMPGSPMVYYGDEYGMYGADDPDCRKPLPWPDRGPYASSDQAADPALRAHFRAWLRLRSDPELGPVLRYGDVRYSAPPGLDAIVIERRLNDRLALAILNRSPSTSVDATPLLSPGASLRLMLGEERIPPLSGSIWFGSPDTSRDPTRAP